MLRVCDAIQALDAPLFDGLAPDVLSELVPLFQMEEYGTGNQCVFRTAEDGVIRSRKSSTGGTRRHNGK